MSNEPRGQHPDECVIISADHGVEYGKLDGDTIKVTGRAIVTDGYEVHPGTNIICSPGKFEGEPTYVPDYWRDSDGCDETIDDDDTPVSVFILGEKDRTTIGPDADGQHALLLWEDGNGFVHSQFMTEAELKAARTRGGE
jgi:hypothetical protein